jgi:hypothetical protein
MLPSLSKPYLYIVVYKIKNCQLLRKKSFKRLIVFYSIIYLLIVSTASGIKPIRNCLGIIEKNNIFFNTSKRKNILLACIENSNENSKVKTLKKLCATRWVQRYTAL